MRLIYFGNNWLGWKVLEFLQAQGEDLAALVVHPPGRRKCGDEILAAAALPPGRVFDASLLREPATRAALAALQPDLGVSISLGYILRRELLDCFPTGCINLHTSFLPWNRGANPNVWSIAERTPAGVTLHFLDEGVDTGDLIAQERVPVEPADTGQTLYARLEQAALALFIKTWPAIRRRAITPVAQDRAAGSTHRLADLARLDAIDLDRSYVARDLIDLLRARTFPPYSGAYFIHEGRKISLQLTLRDEGKTEGAAS